MLWIKLDIPNERYYIDISKLSSMRLMTRKGELWLRFISDPDPLIIRNDCKRILNQILSVIDANNSNDTQSPLCEIKEVDYDDCR